MNSNVAVALKEIFNSVDLDSPTPKDSRELALVKRHLDGDGIKPIYSTSFQHLDFKMEYLEWDGCEILFGGRICALVFEHAPMCHLFVRSGDYAYELKTAFRNVMNELAFEDAADDNTVCDHPNIRSL